MADQSTNLNEESSRGLLDQVASKLEEVSGHLKDRKWAEYDKTQHIAYGCYGGVDSEVPYYDRLQYDLATSNYWSKNLAYDYVFYLANWHPLLGLFLSHPNHPWGKLERFQMLIISLSLTLMPATFIAREQLDDGFLHKVPWNILRAYTIIFITIPDTFIGIILYQLSIAETRCPTCDLLLVCLRKTKNCCMCVVFFFAALIGALCILFLHSHDEKARWSSIIPPLAYGILYSYVLWIPIFTLLPCGLGFLSGWCNEKNAPPETNDDQQPAPVENQDASVA